MRVGLVIYGSLDTLSGGYLYDRMLVNYLRRQGDDVQMISFPWQDYAHHLLHNLQPAWQERLARLDVDVLLEDELNHPSLAWTNPQARKKGAAYPIVSIVHHLRSSEAHPELPMALYRRVETAYLRSVDGFVFNSQATRSAVEHRLGGSDRPCVVAIPGGDRFGAGLSENEITARCRGRKRLRILFVGNLIERKGLHILIRAAAGLPEEAWELRIAGRSDVDPAYARLIKAMAVTMGLREQVTFLGALDDAALAGELRAADLLAMPSQYEGFGIVYLEGMSFGLPPVASSAGASGEIITDGEDGWMIPTGDWQALAQRLMVCSVDRERLLRMSLAARRRYEQFPTWEESMEKIREFLCTL